MSRPWMPLYVADYLADTAHLSAAESGAYLHLIMHYWQRGSLPDDDVMLARIAKMTSEEFSNAKAMLQQFFSNGWEHSRIDRELADAQAAYERRAMAGKRGGQSKSAKNPSNAKAMPEQCQSNAVAMLKQSQPQPHISSSLRSEDTRDERASVANEAARSFELFWDAWPNKTGKPAAIKAFFKVWRETDAIIAGVNRYIRDKPADRPWLNPSTFLNQRRWEDQPAPVANARAGPGGEKSGVAKLLAEAYGIDQRDGTQAQGDPSDFRALPVPHGGERVENHGDDGGVFGRLLIGDGG